MQINFHSPPLIIFTKDAYILTTYIYIYVLGVRRSDIKDRYRFDTGIFCWIGVSV